MNRQPVEYEEVYDDALEDEEEEYETRPRIARPKNHTMTNLIAVGILVVLGLGIVGTGAFVWNLMGKGGSTVTTNPTADALNTEAAVLLQQSQGLVAQDQSTPVPAVEVVGTQSYIPISTTDPNGCVTAQVVYNHCDNNGDCQYLVLGSNDVFHSTAPQVVGNVVTACK